MEDRRSRHLRRAWLEPGSIMAYYADQLMKDPLDRPLVCERFIRVWPLPV